MALLIPDRTLCPLCARVIRASDDVRAFPAFLRSTHALASFSDAAFHAPCFDADPRAPAVEELFARYQEIWRSRPIELVDPTAMDQWVRDAFKDFG